MFCGGLLAAVEEWNTTVKADVAGCNAVTMMHSISPCLEKFLGWLHLGPDVF